MKSYIYLCFKDTLQKTAKQQLLWLVVIFSQERNQCMYVYYLVCVSCIYCIIIVCMLVIVFVLMCMQLYVCVCVSVVVYAFWLASRLHVVQRSRYLCLLYTLFRASHFRTLTYIGKMPQILRAFASETLFAETWNCAKLGIFTPLTRARASPNIRLSQPHCGIKVMESALSLLSSVGYYSKHYYNYIIIICLLFYLSLLYQ